MQTAQTILQQLGGGKFVAMTGTRHLCGDESRLMFGLPARLARDGINKVVVTLEPTDTYKVEFFKIRGTNVRLVAEDLNVYGDQLQRVFTARTGLDTQL